VQQVTACVEIQVTCMTLPLPRIDHYDFCWNSPFALWQRANKGDSQLHRAQEAVHDHPDLRADDGRSRILRGNTNTTQTGSAARNSFIIR
jgi:hypothetical protein